MLPCPAVAPPSLPFPVPGLTRMQAAAAAALLAVVALLVGQGRVSYAQTSDPFGTLLVSQALVRHGTIHLERLDVPDLGGRLAYRGFVRNGHTYYVYPLGTALAATPFVALADAFGVDLAPHEAEVRLQHWIATLAAIVLVALLLRLARRLLPFWPALTCTAAFWAGTTLSSTGGTALWSHIVAAIVALAAIDAVVAAELEHRPVAWLPLGALLFAGYLTRPTAALLAALLLLWVAQRDRAGALKSACVAGGLMVAFVAFSWQEFGELVPPYYRLGLEGGAFSAEALAGLLVSPSRGLLVFSPMLLAVWTALPLAQREWPLARGWWLVGLAWPVLLILALSRWTMWWGGGCYGPRLLTDVLPGLFLLTLRAWPVRWPNGATWASVGVLAVAVMGSTYVHVAQGLYNPWTLRWNAEPSVDTEPWVRWAWRFPQFLHGAAQHRARLVAYYARQQPGSTITPVRSGDVLEPASPHFEDLGFDRMRPTGRWTVLPVAELLFTRADRADVMRTLVITVGTNGRQALRLELNQAVLFDATVDDADATLRVSVPRSAWMDGVNRLRFVLPDTRRMRRGDAREYGIVVRTLRFEP